MKSEQPEGLSVSVRIDGLQKTMNQILDVQKAQLIELRRFVDMLEEMTYVDEKKRRILGVADLKE